MCFCQSFVIHENFKFRQQISNFHEAKTTPVSTSDAPLNQKLVFDIVNQWDLPEVI